MDSFKNSAVLDMLEQPGFIVENGRIVHTNAAARRNLFENGMLITDLIANGSNEYQVFTNGCLYLTIHHNAVTYDASVNRIDGQDIFLLESSSVQSELRALALAAAQLRMPLADISNALDELSKASSSSSMQQIRRNVHRMMRILGNMSDASVNPSGKANLITYDLTALFDEIIEKASALLHPVGTTIDYSAPNEHIYAQVDKDILYRAIYNMLSNCVKFAVKGAPVTVKLSKLSHTVLFSVAALSDTKFPVNPFARYQREAGLEDSRNGIGLGMVMIRSAAAAHGGTVLLEQLSDGQIRTSITIPLKSSNNATVRTHILLPDVYGGNDQALIELSDILPNSAYADN